MNRSQKILFNTETQTSDKYIKIRLEQDVDALEFLSLNISAEDVYQNFNADYGVLVGRVTANGGVGIPNAKISIFIPLDDVDAKDGDIVSVYPYKTPRDKNDNGKRYNLLPRVGKVDPTTGIISPKQPFGSFPIKEELVTNEIFLNVYKKYYKYTATTNAYGDYMIFGVPIGTQTVHMSVDITDIGEYSMTAASMVTNLGYSPNLFYDNNSKIKSSNDLNDLPNIETQEITVDVIPFWGDTINFEIGITRQDFRIRAILTNTFIIFGTVFTDGERSMWGNGSFSGDKKINELYTINGDSDIAYTDFSIKSKRIGKVTEKIYYYPPEISDVEIDAGNVDPRTNMLVLDPSEYSTYKRDGDFVFIINCNRNKVTTDETGKKIAISYDSPDGVFTKFRGFLTLEITKDDVSLDWYERQDKITYEPTRVKLKFPQSGATGYSGLVPEDYEYYSLPNPYGTTYLDNYSNFFNNLSEIPNKTVNNQAWRKQHYTFNNGCFYSIAKFNSTVFNSEDNNTNANTRGLGNKVYYSLYDKVNIPYQLSPGRDTGVILTNDITDTVSGNSYFQMIPNAKYVDSENSKYNETFGGTWLNLCVYLPQFGYVSDGYSYIDYWRSNTNFQNIWFNKQPYFYIDNLQPIAAGDYNTKWFARNDLHWTDFILIPKGDIIKMLNWGKKGFIDKGLSGFTGTYKTGNSPCPVDGGKLNGNNLAIKDSTAYFYKGLKGADCLEYLTFLGIV